MILSAVIVIVFSQRKNFLETLKGRDINRRGRRKINFIKRTKNFAGIGTTIGANNRIKGQYKKTNDDPEIDCPYPCLTRTVRASYCDCNWRVTMDLEDELLSGFMDPLQSIDDGILNNSTTI